MTRTTPEGAVLAACLKLLELRGVFCWRNNSGATRAADRFIRYGKVGSADIICVLPGGRAGFFEIKAPGGRPTAAQRAFLDAVNAAGGLGLVVDDVGRLDAVLDRLRADPKAKAEELS